jgi:hypothetical protein
MAVPAMACRGLAAGLFLALAVHGAAGQSKAKPESAPKDALLAGGKLVCKLPHEVYRDPIFLDTKKGPRLAVWVHESDPIKALHDAMLKKAAPKPNKAGVPAQLGSPFELFIWDATTGKRLYRLTKKHAPPEPPGITWLFGRRGEVEPFGQLVAVPTGTKLVSTKFVNTKDPPGIKVYDLDSRKWKTVPSSTNAWGFRQALFAPSGALVVVAGEQCIVEDLGKAKPRVAFTMERPDKPEMAVGLTRAWTEAFSDAALTPSGKTLALAGDGNVYLFNMKTGKPLWRVPRIGAATGHYNQRLPAALAFKTGEAKLLAVETAPDAAKGKVVLSARIFDVLAKKQMTHATLLEGGSWKEAKGLNGTGQPFTGFGMIPDWGQAYPYFNGKNEPRVVIDGKLFDAAGGKRLAQGEPGYRYILSRDGKYAVRLTPPTDNGKRGVELWSMDRDR